jgi:hypothetical protein
MNKLKQLDACGQSPWLDYLKRSLVESGELRTLIERDGLKGVTSNPSIFEKAIGETDEYADALKQFQSQGDHGISAIYEHLAITDIRAAADVLRPVYEQTKGRDGYISLECSPYLANDTAATVDEALRLWAAVERPNLMVKVPATPAGLPAIRQLIGRGLNINITLLFAVSVYEQVVDAYISGLEDLARTDGDVSKIGSVASIFALTEEYEKSHSLPKEEPMFRENGIAVYADPRNAAELGRHNTLTGYLKSHFDRVRAGDYVALLAYIERDEPHTRALTKMRTRIRDRTHAATCLGFGPRFQHSTGQAYKGGPNSGVFLQITCDDPADIDVPGHSYSFGVVKAAQARGDLAVLVDRGRRALRVHLKDVGAGLTELTRAMDAALQ